MHIIYSIFCFLLAKNVFSFISNRYYGTSRRFNYLKRPKLAISANIEKVGSAPLDWENLGFEYRETNCFVQVKYGSDKKWGEVESKSGEPYIKLHISATSLHYGQSCFEGLKAFQCKDGEVRLFRPDENAKRLAKSCERVCMPPIPEEKFIEACKMAVRENIEFVPPYGSGGALYIRPLLFGSGPKIGLSPADEYTMIVLVIPVGDYYKGGLKPVSGIVMEEFDRAAPRGVGNVKVAGNYAGDLLPNSYAKQKGFPICLYLDALTKSKVEEFSTSNFVAVDKDGNYVTPASETILASITNKSLMELAADEGMGTARREIPVEELLTLREVAACGTAVVVTPVSKLYYKEDTITFGVGDAVGPVTRKLYDRVRAIQNGEAEDTFNWMKTIH